MTLLTSPDALPDLSGLAAAPAKSWRSFGSRLTEIGFGAAFCAAMWQGPEDYYAGLHRAVHEWRVVRLAEPAAVIYQLFCVGHEVARGAAASALTGPVMATAVEAGLLVPGLAGGVRAVLQLRVHDGMFVLCDDLEHRGDVVFGVGVGNRAFRGIVSVRWPAGTAVDVGCGAGATALTLSRHAKRVVATDINERALTVARVNAQLNGVTTIDFRSGDLFEPLAGQTFDLLVAQPPFVPQAPLANDATYQFGGADGTDVVSRMLAGTAKHLAPGGRAAIVYEAPLLADQGDIDPWCSLVPEPGLHTLRLLGSPIGADGYSTRYALPTLRLGADRYDAAVADMRSHLHDRGIVAIRPAVAVFERTDHSPAWAETVQLEGSLWDGIGSLSLWRLLRGVAAVRSGPHAVASAPIHLPGDALVVEQASSGGDYVHLALPASHLGRTSMWCRADLELLRSLAAEPAADGDQHPGDDHELDVRRRALLAGLHGGEPGQTR